MQPFNCLNCGEPLVPAKKFCASCGQKSVVNRVSLREIGHEAIHYFTHANNSIFRLIKELAIHPGKAGREFVAGQRKKYFPPLNFFLIVAATSLFMGVMVHNYKLANPEKYRRVTNVQSSRPPIKNYDPAIQKRSAQVGKFYAKYSNLITMGATPLLCILLWLFYMKGRYNYAEHLVANMYISGVSILVYSLVIQPASLLVTGNYLLYIYFLFELVYRSISYYYFINQKTRASLVKAILANLGMLVFWVLLNFLLVAIYMTNGFWGLVD